MSRSILQPFGRFAFVAISAHVVMGVVIWLWLNRVNEERSSSASLTWVSPADFEPLRAAPASEMPVVVEPNPRPMPEAKSATKPEAKSEAKTVMAVTQAPPAPPPPEPVPKAIPIDPERAMALMERQKAITLAGSSPAVAAPATAPPIAAAPPPQASSLTPAEEPPVPSDVSRTITVSKRPGSAATTHQAASLLSLTPFDAGANDAATDKNKGLLDMNRAIINAFMRLWSPPKAETLRIDQREVNLDAAVDRKGRLLSFKLVKESGDETLDISVLAAANQLDRIAATLPASFPAESYEFQLHFHVE